MFNVIRKPKQKPAQIIRVATREELEKYEKNRLARAEEYKNIVNKDVKDKNY